MARYSRRERATTTATSTQPGRSLVAASAPVSITELAWNPGGGVQDWQREAWRIISIVGEAAFAADWVSGAAASALIKMYEIGEDGNIAGETQNKKARRISASVLGNEVQRKQLIKLAVYDMFVAGEVYFIATSGEGQDADEWLAVSGNDLKRTGGGVTVDTGDGTKKLAQGRDLIIRVWNPDPARISKPYSSIRTSLVLLSEIEKLTQFVFAQIHSRLASAGLLVVPNDLTVNDGGTLAEDVTARLVNSAAEGVRGEGTAASVVPLVIEVPESSLGKLQLIQFTSELSDKAKTLRDEALQRLARSLSLPTERITGLGDVNHWGAYVISEEGINAHIKPCLALICTALHKHFVVPALKAAGLDPKKFQLWYDTTPLTVRPQRLNETLELYRAGLVSAQAVLDAGAYYDTDAPEEAESLKRFMRELLLRDPQLFNQASVRELLGFPDNMIQETTPADMDGEQLLTDSKTPPPPPPAPEILPKEKPGASEPEMKQPRQVTAAAAPMNSIVSAVDVARAAAANVLAVRALEMAGGKLLDHKTRNTMKGIPRFELHTHIDVDAEKADKILEGTMTLVDRGVALCGLEAADVGPFSRSILEHCRETIISGQLHDPWRLVQRLATAQLVGAGK